MSISGRRFGLLVLALALAAGASSSAFASRSGSTNPTMRVQFIHMNQHLSDMYGLGTYIGLRYPDLSGPSLERLRMTGVDWVREEFTASDLHHSVNAPLQFQNDDRVINQERRDGLHILGLLDYNNTFNGEPHTNMPHRDIQQLTRDFVAYVSATVRHYRNQIYYWQVWNEPDLHEFWGPETYAQDYAYLLRQAYGAIKQANPQAKVLIGGPSGRDPHGMHFIKRVIQFGGKFDIMSAQPYTTEPGPDFGVTLQKLRAFHKPVWVTEMGWAGEAYCGPCGSPWDQAARLTTAYFIAAIGGIDRMFWYDFRDDGLGPNFPDHFGLVEWNLAAKPAYLSFETSLFLLNQSTLTGRQTFWTIIDLDRFSGHGKSYYIVWNKTPYPQPITLKWNLGQVRVVDYLGNQIGTSSGHKLQLYLKPRMIEYIVPSSMKLPQYVPSGLQILPGHSS